METRPNLIAIVGPTASGKTGLALALAERYDAEIICADSRTVYRYLDIGTAKPTTAEQARVRHWGLDLIDPDQRFSAADFKRYAEQAVADIHGRGKPVILVGGTGLYIDSLLYDFSFNTPPVPLARARLDAQTVDELVTYCREHNVSLPQNVRNKRHLIAAIERNGRPPHRKQPLTSTSVIVGLATKPSTLRRRIEQRTEHIFEQNVIDEAIAIGTTYGWHHESLSGNIYPLLKQVYDNVLTIEEAKEKFTTLDYRLAKRQMTWFRRNPDIMWCTLDSADAYVQSLLAAE